MIATFKIDGMKELDTALGELPKASAKAVNRRVLLKAGEPMRARAEQLSPEDTGYLSRKVQIGRGLNKSERQRERKRNKKSFTEISLGPVTRAATRFLKEYGTVDMPAQPYMRPAWDEHKMNALNTIRTELGKEIEKTAKRLERKRARSA